MRGHPSGREFGPESAVPAVQSVRNVRQSTLVISVTRRAIVTHDMRADSVGWELGSSESNALA